MKIEWVIGLILGGVVLAMAKKVNPGNPGGDSSTSNPAPYLDTSRWPGNIARWATEIEGAARKFSVDPHLLAAIMMQESGGNPSAARLERGYMARYVSGNPRWDAARRMGWTDEQLATSWGLMQVLGTTAWADLGAHYPPSRIVEPDLNVRLGAKYLRKMLDRYGGDTFAALLAYNGGPAAVNAWRTGDGFNLDYAYNVLAIYNRYKPGGE